MISYLNQLKFDPKLNNSFHAKYLSNIRLVFLVIFTILALGITSFLILPRRLNPEIKLTIVTVATVLPGAGPEDMETLVTKPLEAKLTGVKGLDTITSVSKDNLSLIAMQFLSSIEKDKARADVQTAVSEVTALPSDAQNPKVTALDFEDTPIWTFSIFSKINNDYPSLMRFSDNLKDKVKKLPNVDRVVLNGQDIQEIQVLLDEQKIRQYQINPLILSQAVKNATMSFPAGTINSDYSSFTFSIDTQAVNIEDIRNLHLRIQGQPMKLGDIANVSEKSKKEQHFSYIATKTSSTQPAVVFSVYKTSSSDIDKTTHAVETLVNDTLRTNNNYQIASLLNTGDEISVQFSELVDEFRSTLILVFINLLLFLGLRQASIAIMTIPLTFLMSFAWMNIFGQTINFISLFALLLAFGTSIDDTIVTVSAMTTYYRTKKFTPWETGLLVWRDFVIPIWTTTVTTVWAFLPLILTSGIIGEFIKPIPLVVASTMYTSTAVTWFITLPMMIVLLKIKVPGRVKTFLKFLSFILMVIFLVATTPKNLLLLPVLLVFLLFAYIFRKTNHVLKENISVFAKNNYWTDFIVSFIHNLATSGFINTELLSSKYQKIIIRILSSKRGRRITLTCLILFAVSSYLLIPFGLVKNEFFPKTNTDTFYLNLEMPAGTNVEAVDKEVRNILETLRQTPETITVSAEVGAQLSDMGATQDSANTALFTLNLEPKEKRKNTSPEIAQSLRNKFDSYNKGSISVIETTGGPPAGADVQIKLLGDDLNILNDYADKIIIYLRKQPGLINIDKSIKPGTSKIVFIPDKLKMAEAGLSLDIVGLSLRTSASGFVLDTVNFNNKDKDVVFYTTSGVNHPENIANIMIPTQNGSIPLFSLGKISLKANPTVINREGGQRTVSVAAGVSPGFSVSDANSNLLKFADEKLNLPEGYEYKTGGVNEENQKSVASMLRAMGLSFILIMATMVIEFNSFRQAAMILSLIPFAVSGVFIVFALSGTPLSFPSLIGIMALFGVVVTNAMFIVEKINQNRKKGMRLIEAIGDAGKSRLEPIMLTSLTSIFGLIPITLANPLWRGLGGAIISGLMFSGAIMLLFIPVTYYTIYQKEEKNNSGK